MPAATAEAGEMPDQTRTGTKISEEMHTERNKTGRTAFPFSERFLNTSYMPKKKAEHKAYNTHIAAYQTSSPLPWRTITGSSPVQSTTVEGFSSP